MSYTLSRDIATLLGLGRIATRNDILTAFLRYSITHGLLEDRTQITPDAALTVLCGSADPFPVKDMFLELRPHIKAVPAPAVASK
jgi:chromatin remodeling complex protein RSC6